MADELRIVEFLYRYEGDEGWGKRTAKFHRWFEWGKELCMLVENDEGEVKEYSRGDIADIKFLT